jgi:hypothetical protein
MTSPSPSPPTKAIALRRRGLRFLNTKPSKRLNGPPSAGYFALSELNELNSGYYHDSCHALEVAELVKEIALNLGRTEERAEFLKQVALVHDADPRICSETGQAKPGTPARVQVTLSWMESERKRLESRFGWEGFQFAEACALIARTDFPFDRAPRTYGTRFDGMSPVEVYRQQIWSLPSQARANCFTDALILRFADQVSAYVSSFERARRSVRDLVDELTNTGAHLTFDDVLQNTPNFLRQVGRDLDYDRDLRDELNLSESCLIGRSALLSALGWGKRFRLAWNVAKFRFGHSRSLIEFLKTL